MVIALIFLGLVALGYYFMVVDVNKTEKKMAHQQMLYYLGVKGIDDIDREIEIRGRRLRKGWEEKRKEK